MALGDTLRRIVASDNFILNAAGALVGIKNPNANGLDLRVDAPAAYLPSILAQNGAPVVLPSSGSSNATGQITLTTALPYQPVGTVGLYLPANVVVGDAAGGIKQVVFSSTTVCQIVGSPATANAAYTQTTGSVALATVSVPGSATGGSGMGANGALRVGPLWTLPSNANGKTFSMTFGGQSMLAFTVTASTQETRDVRIRNKGVTNAQISTNWAGYTNASPAILQGTVDTTVPQALAILGAIAVTTDYLILEGYTVELLPAA